MRKYFRRLFALILFFVFIAGLISSSAQSAKTSPDVCGNVWTSEAVPGGSLCFNSADLASLKDGNEKTSDWKNLGNGRYFAFERIFVLVGGGDKLVEQSLSGDVLRVWTRGEAVIQAKPVIATDSPDAKKQPSPAASPAAHVFAGTVWQNANVNSTYTFNADGTYFEEAKRNWSGKWVPFSASSIEVIPNNADFTFFLIISPDGTEAERKGIFPGKWKRVFPKETPAPKTTPGGANATDVTGGARTPAETTVAPAAVTSLTNTICRSEWVSFDPPHVLKFSKTGRLDIAGYIKKPYEGLRTSASGDWKVVSANSLQVKINEGYWITNGVRTESCTLNLSEGGARLTRSDGKVWTRAKKK